MRAHLFAPPVKNVAGSLASSSSLSSSPPPEPKPPSVPNPPRDPPGAAGGPEADDEARSRKPVTRGPWLERGGLDEGVVEREVELWRRWRGRGWERQ